MASNTDYSYSSGAGNRSNTLKRKATADHHNKRNPCDDYIDGSCPDGQTCERGEHPPNLHPQLHKADDDYDPNFKVSTDKGAQDCLACITKGIKVRFATLS